jgi:AcrR family transcriptional regulator
MSLETGETATGTRSERRRQRTRARIVEAAERLMRERGVDAVTVQGITEEADVGHGTFYCHFDSKAEVLRPLIDELAKRIHVRVDRVTGGRRDPALRLSAGVRVALRAIASDPLWNWYVFQSGTPFRRLAEGMGAPPVEDMNRGVASDRFQVRDLRATWSFIDGALIGVLTCWNQGLLGEDAAETTAELVLRSLGVSPEEAQRIAHEPLDPS